jgi:hypothetical protein
VLLLLLVAQADWLSRVNHLHYWIAQGRLLLLLLLLPAGPHHEPRHAC